MRRIIRDILDEQRISVVGTKYVLQTFPLE